jgi:hypothetical protein
MTNEQFVALARQCGAEIGESGGNVFWIKFHQPSIAPFAAAVAQGEGGLREALTGASNYIDTLGGDSKRYRAALAATPPAATQVPTGSDPRDSERMAFLAEHWLSTVPEGMRLHQWLGEISTLMKHGSLRGAIDAVRPGVSDQGEA